MCAFANIHNHKKNMYNVKYNHTQYTHHIYLKLYGVFMDCIAQFFDLAIIFIQNILLHPKLVFNVYLNSCWL